MPCSHEAHDAIDESSALDSRDRTRRIFDEVASLLADGRAYLTAAFAAPLVLPDEPPATNAARLGDALPGALAGEAHALAESPAGRFAARLYRDHRRPHLH